MNAVLFLNQIETDEGLPMNQDPGNNNSVTTGVGDPNPSRKWVGIVYLIQILSLGLGGIPLLAGLAINYAKHDAVRGSWLDSHFKWQITTFWYIFVLVIGALLSFGTVVAYFLTMLAGLLLIYRVFRGWSFWNIDSAIDSLWF